MKWFSRGNFKNGTQAFVSFISPEHLRHRVLGWKLFGSLQIFAILSFNIDHLFFARWEYGVKSLHSEGTKMSHPRYIIIGNGYREPVWLVYSFLGTQTTGIPLGFLQKATPLIHWIKRLKIKGGESNGSLMGLGQSLYFLSGLETFLITTYCVNTALKVVYRLSKALNTGVVSLISARCHSTCNTWL